MILGGDEYENVELNQQSVGSADILYSSWWAGTAFEFFVTGTPGGGSGGGGGGGGDC